MSLYVNVHYIMKLVFAQQRSKIFKDHKCICVFEYQSCSCLLVFWSCIGLTSTLICNTDHFLWWNTIQQLHLLQLVKDKSFLAHCHNQDSDEDSLDSQLIPALSCWPQHYTTATEEALSAPWETACLISSEKYPTKWRWNNQPILIFL